MNLWVAIAAFVRVQRVRHLINLPCLALGPVQLLEDILNSHQLIKP